MTPTEQYLHDIEELGERVAWLLNEERLDPMRAYRGVMFDAAIRQYEAR